MPMLWQLKQKKKPIQNIFENQMCIFEKNFWILNFKSLIWTEK